MALKIVYCVFCFRLDITQLLTNFLDSKVVETISTERESILKSQTVILRLLTFTKEK